jgi:putative sterol carrier protein
MAEIAGVDPSKVSPEEFATLVANTDDAQLSEILHAVGTEQVLDRIFEGMKERFRPDKAAGVDATIGFVVTDDDAEYPYAVKIANGTCEVDKRDPEGAKVTIKTDALSFAKLVTGQADGPKLFMQGKLKLSGDLMFSMRIMSFFDRPRAS